MSYNYLLVLNSSFSFFLSLINKARYANRSKSYNSPDSNTPILTNFDNWYCSSTIEDKEQSNVNSLIIEKNYLKVMNGYL